MVATLKRPQTVGLQIIRKDLWVPEELDAQLRRFNPRSELGKSVAACLHYLPRDLALELVDRLTSIVVVESSLRLTHFHHDGHVEYLGLVSEKKVTNAGVEWFVDMWQNTYEPETMKYHGIGTDNTAEVNWDTGLQAEITGEYNPNNTRGTGTTEQAAANIFKAVGTATVDSAVSIVEHGLFNNATSQVGILWDRSVFSAVALASGDGLQGDYRATFSAGG